MRESGSAYAHRGPILELAVKKRYASAYHKHRITHLCTYRAYASFRKRGTVLMQQWERTGKIKTIRDTLHLRGVPACLRMAQAWEKLGDGAMSRKKNPSPPSLLRSHTIPNGGTVGFERLWTRARTVKAQTNDEQTRRQCLIINYQMQGFLLMLQCW